MAFANYSVTSSTLGGLTNGTKMFHRMVQQAQERIANVYSSRWYSWRYRKLLRHSRRFSMSVLELNGRIFDASTTGTLTLTGEGGAATTDVTQGLTKALDNFNGTGTIATRDSFNDCELTDVSTGSINVAITNNMA